MMLVRGLDMERSYTMWMPFPHSLYLHQTNDTFPARTEAHSSITRFSSMVLPMQKESVLVPYLWTHSFSHSKRSSQSHSRVQQWLMSSCVFSLWIAKWEETSHCHLVNAWKTRVDEESWNLCEQWTQHKDQDEMISILLQEVLRRNLIRWHRFQRQQLVSDCQGDNFFA